MKTEILEKNKEIAKYMGATIHITSSGREIYRFYDEDGLICDANQTDKLRYSYSWDWIMPVLIKISSIDSIFKAGVHSILDMENLDINKVFDAVANHAKLQNDKP